MIWKQCKNKQDSIVKMRRDLHKIPELGCDLPKTKAYVINLLQMWNIPYTESVADSSIIAIIEGVKPGKTIALRADMDALPIQEENECDYRSEHPGKMHACGHDAHTAVLLACAEVLQENRHRLCGRVKLLFQTGEEIAKGAKIMIAEGALDGVDAIFGFHVGSILGKQFKSGTFIIAPSYE